MKVSLRCPTKQVVRILVEQRVDWMRPGKSEASCVQPCRHRDTCCSMRSGETHTAQHKGTKSGTLSVSGVAPNLCLYSSPDTKMQGSYFKTYGTYSTREDK